MKWAISNSLAAAVLVSMPCICLAQEFSADVIYLPVPAVKGARAAPPPGVQAKLYVKKGQLRLEAEGVTRQILISDDANHTTVALSPMQKSYQELGDRPAEYFRVADAENACPEWQRAVGKKFGCERVGNDEVAGRSTVKYEGHTSTKGADYIWVDPRLMYVIKWQAGDTEAELRNIKEGLQAADLFEVPQDYGPMRPKRRR